MTAPVALPAPIAAYYAAYNARDVEGMLVCLHGNIVFRDYKGDERTVEARGRFAFEELATASAKAFSKRRQEVLRATTIEDVTLAEIRFTATVARDLPNGWRAGQTVTFEGATLFRLKKRLIRRIVDRRTPSAG